MVDFANVGLLAKLLNASCIAPAVSAFACVIVDCEFEQVSGEWAVVGKRR